MEKLVSVIVPVYNIEAHLKECIRSILNQTYQRLEILLVNDGSTDKSGQICDHYGQMDSRIKVLYKGNSGVSATRNCGIEKSTGQYLCFVDSDDFLRKNAIEVLVNAIKISKVQAVYSNYEYAYEGRRIKRLPRLKGGIYPICLLKDKIVDDGTLSGILLGSVCGAIFQADIIRENQLKFNEQVSCNEDGLFNLLFCQHIDKIEYLDLEYLYIYRQWKIGRTTKIKKLMQKYQQADQGIQNILGTFISKTSQVKQMASRKIFVTFHLSVTACENMSYHVAQKYLDKMWNSPEINNYKNYLDLQNMNIYKKCLCYLMNKRKKRCFYFLIHYIYPILRSVIVR